MSDQEKEEAKQRKFQDRFERISRRRFVQAAAALGGVGISSVLVSEAVGIAPEKREDAALLEKRFEKLHLPAVTASISDKCRNTLALLLDFQVNALFMNPLYPQLDASVFGSAASKGKKRLDDIDAAIWRDLVAPFRSALTSWPDVTLYQLYTTIQDEWQGTVGGAAFNAARSFILPFFSLPDVHRAAAKEFLDETKRVPDPADPGQTVLVDFRGFFDVFGGVTVSDMLLSRRGLLGEWELHLLRMARSRGILKTHPSVVASQVSIMDENTLEKQKCLVQVTPTQWNCFQSQDESDMCGRDDQGYPLSGSDLCN